jgi:hypothetical protein
LTVARRQLLLTLALALAALICIDCLNLTQSEAWSDITRAPHLAAVRRATDTDAHRVVNRLDPDPVGAVLPATIAVWVAWLLVGVAVGSASLVSARPRFRQRKRAPPAPPVQPIGTPGLAAVRRLGRAASRRSPFEPEEVSCQLTIGIPCRSRRRTHPTITSTRSRTWRSWPGPATSQCGNVSRPLAPRACS